MTSTPNLFSFEHDGETYTFERPLDVVTSPGWLRANRRRDELDLTFTIMEEVAGDDVLAVIDTMSKEDFANLAKALQKALGAALGE